MLLLFYKSIGKSFSFVSKEFFGIVCCYLLVLHKEKEKQKASYFRFKSNQR